MSRDAEILSTRFTKGVIRSRAALTYAEAQARIDDPSQTDEVTTGETRDPGDSVGGTGVQEKHAPWSRDFS
jgi:hypothetical protein